jgi:hypothetical protein
VNPVWWIAIQKGKQLPEPISPDPSVKGLSLRRRVDVDEATIRVFDQILIVQPEIGGDNETVSILNDRLSALR